MLMVVVVGLNLLLMLLLLMRVSMVTNTAQNPPALHNIHPCISPDRAHLGAIQIMSSTSATMDQVTMK